MKAATVICQQIFSILASVIFLLKILLKSASKSSCTTTVRGWTTKSRTTKFSADNTFISGKLCGPLNQSLLMLRWSADKVLPQRGQLSFHCRGLGVRCYEPHPGLNYCASVASPFIWPCEPQNACHLVLVSVCVVTNRTKNHDRIAYMWKKHAVVGAGKCKVSLRSAQCFMQHGLDFCGLLKVWFSEPFPFSGIRPQAGWDGMFGVYLTTVGMRWLVGDLQFGWASGFRISWTPVRMSWYV